MDETYEGNCLDEIAGEIEAVGREVTKFEKGDSIFAPCLLRLGAYAAYACLPEKYLVLKPASITYLGKSPQISGIIPLMKTLMVSQTKS